MEFADRLYRVGADVADRLACRQPSQNMQSAAEPMLGKKKPKGESRAAHHFLMVTVCCFVACSALLCMRVGRVTASYLDPVHLLEVSP